MELQAGCGYVLRASIRFPGKDTNFYDGRRGKTGEPGPRGPPGGIGATVEKGEKGDPVCVFLHCDIYHTVG
ncbi:unnamed protein product [Tetraodon nigroviridis]|uniref:(spotted green pufferfish) hypothetical protein n=1 Tax=Tetraodon nigroviridis TaxID=99883 RepID=Q4RQ88_TETNG|nr:unnamed protein product [Tetraodon nigroviridis]